MEITFQSVGHELTEFEGVDPLRKLMSKARRHRSVELERLRADPHCSIAAGVTYHAFRPTINQAPTCRLLAKSRGSKRGLNGTSGPIAKGSGKAVCYPPLIYAQVHLGKAYVNWPTWSC